MMPNNMDEAKLDEALLNAAKVADTMKGQQPAPAPSVVSLLKARVRAVAGIADEILQSLVDEYVQTRKIKGNPEQIVARLARDVDFLAFVAKRTEEEPNTEEEAGVPKAAADLLRKAME